MPSISTLSGCLLGCCLANFCHAHYIINYKLQKNAVNNVWQRIPIMLEVANDKTAKFRTFELNITEKDKNYIINKVHHEIGCWNGIEIGTCKTEKYQYVDYSNTARNWFNRNKAKIYGNHLFYPIIFVFIYQVSHYPFLYI